MSAKALAELILSKVENLKNDIIIGRPNISVVTLSMYLSVIFHEINFREQIYNLHLNLYVAGRHVTMILHIILLLRNDSYFQVFGTLAPQPL